MFESNNVNEVVYVDKGPVEPECMVFKDDEFLSRFYLKLSCNITNVLFIVCAKILLSPRVEYKVTRSSSIAAITMMSSMHALSQPDIWLFSMHSSIKANQSDLELCQVECGADQICIC